MLLIEAGFWQSPLFILILTVLFGIIGYVIKNYIEYKKAKRLKIKSLELIVGIKYTNGQFVIPNLGVKIENLSNAEIIIQYVSLKHNKYLGMAPIDMMPRTKANRLKPLEILKFDYICGKTHLIINPQTRNLDGELQVPIESPSEFFRMLYNYLNLKTKPLKGKKDFEKRLSGLGVFVRTNIGDYYRKFTKKERKMFFKSVLMKEYELMFPKNQ